jgi:DNA-binding NarL/FixJ family response regulator
MICGVSRNAAWGELNLTEPIQVMIVDDSREMRESLKLILSFSAEIQVVSEAANGLEALCQIPVLDPDVILMDVNMPVLDGIQTTKRIAQLYPTLPVIVLSVQEHEDLTAVSLDSGAKTYLQKPVPIDTLISTIIETRCQMDCSIIKRR